MPRPTSITPEALTRYEALARDAIHQEMPFALGIPQVLEMGIAGAWLHEQVLAAGGSEQEAEDASFATGQMCVGRRDPWLVADRVLALFKDGEAPKPGAELAERLLTGDVSDLPPGGLRIARGGP